MGYRREVVREGFYSPPTRSTNSCTRASHVQLAGNVRELANTIERAALLTKGEAITAKDLGIDRT